MIRHMTAQNRERARGDGNVRDWAQPIVFVALANFVCSDHWRVVAGADNDGTIRPWGAVDTMKANMQRPVRL
jgi:hypothetical protein